jgi:hypothetical protein
LNEQEFDSTQTLLLAIRRSLTSSEEPNSNHSSTPGNGD